jgi:amidase
VTRSVRDSAAVLDAIATPVPGDPNPLPRASGFADAASRHPERALKIGFIDAHIGVTVHPDCSAAVHATAMMLEDLGHHVEPSHPAAIENEVFMRHFANQVCAGAAWLIDHYWPTATGIPVTKEDVEGMTWAMAEVGRGMNAGDFLAGREALQLFSREIATWFDEGGYDMLLSPTTPMPPPEIGSFAPIDTICFAFPFNSSGQPAMSVPVHETSDGFPVGVQLAAKHAQEELLFELAAQLEQRSGWLTRRPPVSS